MCATAVLYLDLRYNFQFNAMVTTALCNVF